MKRLFAALLGLMLLAPATGAVADEAGANAVVVRLAPDVSLTDLPAGAVPVFGDWVRINGPAASAITVADPRFEVVQPDYRHQLIDGAALVSDLRGFATFSTPNDPLYVDQWHIPLVGGDTARDTATGNGVVVAVIDTGLTTAGSEDLDCIGFHKPFNAIDDIEGVAEVADSDGHGTQVISVIAECTDNGVGAAGLAPDVTIMPVKVLDELGQSTSSVVASGISWAAANGADIINLSLGNPSCPSPCDDPVLNAAIDEATAADVLIVAATGNNGGSVAYPANHPAVLAVGAVGADGLIANYSSRGPELDLVAPGGDLGQDLNGDGLPDGILSESFDNLGWAYFYADGTSFSAPIVTAVAAMVREFFPTASAVDVKGVLEGSALDLGTAGFDTTYGHGLVNAPAALSLGGVERLAGLDRYSTAVAVSKSEFDPGVPAAYIATGLNFPDALSAVPAAGRVGGPILLVPGTSLPGSVKSELRRLDPQEIFVLGGTFVVSASVETELASYTTGSVTRLAGIDRYATGAAVSQAHFSSADVVYVATGLSFPDALAGGPLGAVTDGPILLVGTTVPSATRNEILRLKPDEIVVLGGSAVVSDAVVAELGSLAPTRRIAGIDRFTTAVEAAEEAFPAGADAVFIATGFSFPDALAGGPAAVRADGPILLVKTDGIPTTVGRYLASENPSRIVILGGTAAVDDSVAIQLQSYIGP